MAFKRALENMIKKLGYSIHKINKNNQSLFKDIKEPEFWEIYNLCKPYTLTSVERMYGLYNAVNYVLQNKIEGSFVECGVWRGGSGMLVAKMLANRNINDRKIYLYDTFEGMSEPTSVDIDPGGSNAAVLLKQGEHDKQSSKVWCLADLDDVQDNFRLINFSSENLVYIKGKVEDTIPADIPFEPIALLRLDTDWYESTKHELVHLYPKLQKNGILIIDDYGHWEGCKIAVDEYVQEHNISMLLNRIDYSGRIAIKPSL